MPDHLAPPDTILTAARADATRKGLAHAGDVHPRDAWRLHEAGLATLLDIRAEEELRLVGRVPGIAHLPWATGLALVRNPGFLAGLEAAARDGRPLLLLCRSGKRSVDAAELAQAHGIPMVFNILEGFEGDKDPQGQRGHLGGWRFHGLPWLQD